MKRITTNFISTNALIIVLSLTLFAVPAFSQGRNAQVKTDTRITYHNGPVMQGTSNTYVIWYGGWTGWPGHTTTTQSLVFEFVIDLGMSSYLQINISYTDALGNGPSGATSYSGTAYDPYSQGADLDAPKIQRIVQDQITSGVLPLDGAGIYLVFGSADVSANSVGYCQPGAPPHHGLLNFNGAQVKYAFIGHPLRCPTIAAPQLSTAGPTPNGDYSADAIANIVAAAIPATITNPTGQGWFDRYGLDNSTKCAGTFGETYTTTNGARANIQLGVRHWLIQQNWVNSTRKGYCAMAPPQH